MGVQGQSKCAPRIPAAVTVGLLVLILAVGVRVSPAAAFLDAWQEMIPRGKSLGGIAYGDGRLVAVGGNGEMLSSTNSVNWQKGAVPSVGFIHDVTYGNGVFLGVGSITNQGGVVMISTNTMDWTKDLVGPSRLSSCAFGNNMFVAAGHGTLLSSPDGVQWTSRIPANAVVIYGVDFIGNHFVAIGGAGLTTTSPDGVNWSAPATDGGPDLYASAYGDGTTVTVGSGQRIKTTSATNSADSWNWQSEIRLSDVTYGNGRFVAVGFILGFGVVYTSTNGFFWERPILGETYMLHRVTFANGEFVAVGEMGTVLTSTDGMKWTLRRGGLPAPLSCAASANGTVVAVAGSYGAVGTVLNLTGDLNWQIQTWGYNNYPNRIIYTNDEFLAVGSGAIVSSSPDGARWTHRTNEIAGWLNDVIYAQGIYVAVGGIFGGGGLIQLSADGITWSNQSIALSSHLYGVAYGQGRFVTVGSSGVALSSEDASTWATEPTGVSNWLHAVAFGKEAFIAVGDAGVIQRSTNGQTWAIQDSPTTNGLWGVRYLANRFIALGTGGTILSSFDGFTWQEHSSGVTETLYDVVVAENRLWIVGDHGTALVSEHEVYPILQALGWRADFGFEFMLRTDLGRPCRLQASGDFVTWEDLGALPFSDTNHVYLYSSVTSPPIRFYRVVAE